MMQNLSGIPKGIVLGAAMAALGAQSPHIQRQIEIAAQLEKARHELEPLGVAYTDPGAAKMFEFIKQLGGTTLAVNSDFLLAGLEHCRRCLARGENISPDDIGVWAAEFWNDAAGDLVLKWAPGATLVEWHTCRRRFISDAQRIWDAMQAADS